MAPRNKRTSKKYPAKGVANDSPNPLETLSHSNSEAEREMTTPNFSQPSPLGFAQSLAPPPLKNIDESSADVVGKGGQETPLEAEFPGSGSPKSPKSGASSPFIVSPQIKKSDTPRGSAQRSTTTPQKLQVPTGSESATATPVPTSTDFGPRGIAEVFGGHLDPSESEEAIPPAGSLKPLQRIQAGKNQDRLESLVRKRALNQSSAAEGSSYIDIYEAQNEGSEGGNEVHESTQSDAIAAIFAHRSQACSTGPVDYDPDPNVARLQRRYSSEGSFNTWDDGAVPQGLGYSVPPGPFEDSTPSYGALSGATQGAIWESGAARARREVGLFNDPSLIVVSGEDNLKGTQIYDPNTDEAIDHSTAAPRTPPTIRLAQIAAQQKANIEARVVAAEDKREKNEEPAKPSLFSPPGALFKGPTGRIKDAYRNAPTMGDKDGRQFLKETAEKTAREKAEELAREHVEPRQGSLTERLEESVSFYLF
jgi:hypothetical protein